MFSVNFAVSFGSITTNDFVFGKYPKIFHGGMKMTRFSILFLVALVLMFIPLMSMGLDPDLVLYMPFDEGSGVTTQDISEKGNNGELVGAVVWSNDGKFGNALEFNGVDSQVVIQSSASLQPDDSDFTIEAWIKADPGSQDWARVVDKFYGTGYCFGKRGADLVIGSEFGGNPNDFASTTEVFDNEWHHVALVRDVKGVEDLKVSQLKIYVDGVKENEIVAPNADVHNMDTTPVRIGAGDECCEEGPSDNAAYFYKGIIDEVLIYRKALTDDEIMTDMESGAVTAVQPSRKLSTTWANIKGY